MVVVVVCVLRAWVVLCWHIVGYSEESAGHIPLRRSWWIVRLQDNTVVEVVVAERRHGIAVVGVGGVGGVVAVVVVVGVVVEAVVVAAALTGLPPAYSCRSRVRFR